MADLRIAFSDDNVGPGLRRSMGRNVQRVRGALLATAHDAREEILTRGRQDIASAGRFGTRWTQGLQVNVEEEEGDDILVNTTHSEPFFLVFEKGKVIHGKPLLWIPLSFAGDAQRVWARNYPGGLFRVEREGDKAPLLFSRVDKQPKYFGKESVTIPKKFHIIEICRDVARRMRDFFVRHMERD